MYLMPFDAFDQSNLLLWTEKRPNLTEAVFSATWQQYLKIFLIQNIKFF